MREPVLRAAIFDVDGTLVDSERHGHRVAFNYAFAQLGLGFHWDERTYGRLLLVPGSKPRLEHFLASEGIPPGRRRRLVPLLHAEKTRRIRRMIEEGAIQPRPGVHRLLSELTAAGVRLGVATAGNRSWVVQLLTSAFPEIPFDVVVTASDVQAAKPNPECYLVALDQLGLPPASVVAVEDSGPGLRAALAAGLATVVVLNDYTAHHDFDGAALVLDGFEPGARVVQDPSRLAMRLSRSRKALDRLALAAVLASGPDAQKGTLCSTT